MTRETRKILLALWLAGGSALTEAADGPQEGAGAPAPRPGSAEKARAEAFVAKADELIRDRNYDARSTPHYKVKTDDPRLNVREAADLLESFRRWFDQFWASRVDLLPYEEPSRIFLFYSRFKYKQLLSEAELAGEETPVGHYRSFVDVVAVHTDTVGPDHLPDVLVHEAAHQLVQMRILGPDAAPSLWLSEGLASYFGNTLRDSSGKFQPGKVGSKWAALFKEARRRRPDSFGVVELREYHAALRKGSARPLDEVVRTTDPAVFYDPTAASARYAASWLLVHYLLHGDAGAHTTAFIQYVKREALGEGDAEVFYRDLGMTPEQLAAAVRDHMKRIETK